MIPAEFDKTGVSGRQRKLIAEAPGTLFPAAARAGPQAAAAAEQLPGQGSLFGDTP